MNLGNQYEFSVCTLYRNPVRYDNLVSSLKEGGFDDGVEFLSINNHLNEWDCYRAIRSFISEAKGDYIIICHDDILPNGNTRTSLRNTVQRILSRDSKAAIFGVAGKGPSLMSGFGHFFSPRGSEYWGFASDGKVTTLDECFLILRRDCQLNVSNGLSGFHFYGADLCLNAVKAGFSCYAIDYPIFHASDGVLDKNFILARTDFQRHLEKTNVQGVIHTTCTSLYGGKSKLLKFYSLFGSYLLIQGSINRKDEETKLTIKNNFGKLFEHNIVWWGFDVCVFFYKCFLITRALLMEGKYILVWKILYPLSWPIRRIYGDVIWWSKHWKTRVR